MTATVTVVTKPHLSIFASDISGQIDDVSPFQKLYEEIESTASGNLSRTHVPGLAGYELTFSVFMTQAIEDTLVANEGTTGAIVFRRSTDAQSSSNPEFTWTGWIKEIPYSQGAVGEPWKAELTIMFASDVTRNAA